MPHYFDDKYTSMGVCRRMNAVNAFCRNIYGTLKAKCHIGSVNIIVDRLRKPHNIQSLFTEKISRFLCSISPKNYKTVQFEITIRFFHRLNLVQSIGIGFPHMLKWLSGRSKNRSSQCENPGKIRRFHFSVISVDQSFITFQNSIYLNVFVRSIKCFCHTAHRRIQCLAVTAACQKGYSLHH